MERRVKKNILIHSPIIYFPNIGESPSTKILRIVKLTINRTEHKSMQSLLGNYYFSDGVIQKETYSFDLSSFLFYIVSLLRFKKLSKKQKLEVTALTNKEFVLSLIKNTQLECKGARYCYERIFSINLDSQGHQNPYFPKILNNLQLACLEDPIIYLQSFDFIQDSFTNWLELVSFGKVFLDSRMAVEKGTNLLWFSRYSFHSFEEILCHEFELTMIKNYYSKSKTQIEFFQFKTYLQENQRGQCLSAININLNKILQDQCIYLRDYAELAASQMEKFKDEKQRRMLDELLGEPLVSKKGKKEGKKKKKDAKQIKPLKNNFPSQLVLKEFEKYANQTQKEFKQTLATQQQLIGNDKISPHKASKTVNIQLSQEKAQKKDVKICDKTNRASQIAHSYRQSQLNLSFEDSYHCSLTKNFIEITPKKTFSPQNIRSSLPMSTEFLDYLNFSQKKRNQDKQEKEETKNTVTKRSKRRSKKEKEATLSAHKIVYNRLLSRQIDNLSRYIITQSNHQHSFKELIFERVKVFIKSLFPYCQAILFGSSSIGLSLANSDIDIQLINIPCKEKNEAGKILSYIQAQMTKMKWITYSQAHIHAKAPVLKIGARPQIPFLSTKHKTSIGFQIYDQKLISSLNKIPNYGGSDINVDITILVNGVTSIGLQTTSYVKEYIYKYPQMRNSYLILKYILARNDFSSNYRGGIGSFYLFIMVAAYFKEYFQQNSPQSQILPLVLESYSQNFTTKLIQLKQQQSCFIQQFEDQSYESAPTIKLINPLNDEIMISKCFKQHQINQQFSRICQILHQWSTKILQSLQRDVKNIPELVKNLQNKRYIDRYLRNLEESGRFNLKEVIDSSKIIVL